MVIVLEVCMGKIVLKDAVKEYRKGNHKIHALNHASTIFDQKGFYVIMGHSGSGKTTLIQVLGLFDELSSGTYLFEGRDVKQYTEKEKANIRNRKIGFVFQNFHLNDYLTAVENVMLPMLINPDISAQDCSLKAKTLLQEVGLIERIHHYPKEMSGGEEQRVAIARALANDPDIILADEPTGNLDVENERNIFKILKKISRNKLVIVVSHNEAIQEYADYVYTMDHGEIKLHDN